MSKKLSNPDIQAKLDEIKKIQDAAAERVKHVSKPLVKALKEQRKDLMKELRKVDDDIEALTGKRPGGKAEKAAKATDEQIVEFLSQGAKTANDVVAQFTIGYQSVVKRIANLIQAGKVVVAKDGKPKQFTAKK